MLAERNYMSLQERFAPIDDAKARFVSMVYSGLTISLLLAAVSCIGSMLVFRTMPFPTVRGITTVLSFVELGMILMTMFARLSGVFGWIWLFLFVTITGITLAPVMMVYSNPAYGGPGVIAAALGTTGFVFVTLSAYVRFSGKDFTYLRGFLFVATMVMCVAMIVLMFWPHYAVQYWMAWIGAILFSGWILYDTSAVTRQYYESNNVVGAILNLYLDILNLFMFLLQIFSGSRRNRD